MRAIEVSTKGFISGGGSVIYRGMISSLGGWIKKVVIRLTSFASKILSMVSTINNTLNLRSKFGD